MREIKFRGLSAAHNRWLYGDLIHNRGRVYIADDSVAADDIRGHTDFEVVPDTVGQFTGLHDYKGREIYEGDIVDVRYISSDGGNETLVVVYHSESAMFGLTTHSKRHSIVEDFKPLGKEFWLTVVGNIHDKTNKQ